MALFAVSMLCCLLFFGAELTHFARGARTFAFWQKERMTAHAADGLHVLHKSAQRTAGAHHSHHASIAPTEKATTHEPSQMAMPSFLPRSLTIMRMEAMHGTNSVMTTRAMVS